MVGGSGFQPRFTRAITVKSSTSSDEANRSHNPKTTDLKLQSFFFDFDQIGRSFGRRPD